VPPAGSRPCQGRAWRPLRARERPRQAPTGFLLGAAGKDQRKGQKQYKLSDGKSSFHGTCIDTQIIAHQSGK